MAQWECLESGGGVLEITSQGMQAAPPTPGVSGGRPRAPGSSSGSFPPQWPGSPGDHFWQDHPSPRATPDGVIGAGKAMPLSHIPTLIC